MPDRPDTAPGTIALAAVAGAHGVAGEVRLKLFGESVEALSSHPSFNDGALTLSKVRSDNKGGAIARFAEVRDRNAAEALRGTLLTVSRSTLPPLEEGEFYHADLIGLAVQTNDGAAVGRVVAVENFGATDIVEIEKPDGKRFMIPLTEDAVPHWDDETLTVDAAFVD
ncbi:16S rRNA processing protein RimM [Altererythrobacter aurantiacus]|uniref:Ribosome maturation factor RimM n=1 Tax=Parapontixanthobacter aurantiacus TaxID=1463599 RepID=A0A844ZCJ0_9SPHN|nr:ribosome maturation factor RimM [Parapontixanthobacter aurantiacus]MXO85498.1 16S rRNA processing protein RimM [Parapontixanthobacter aurantiacus]